MWAKGVISFCAGYALGSQVLVAATIPNAALGLIPGIVASVVLLVLWVQYGTVEEN